MGKSFPEISAELRTFIEAQPVFFVASAPLSPEGHVNLSPKGLDSFRILGPRQVAYVDYIGSGVETIAHVKENGRIVIMFCAFQGAPRILRLHGAGRVVEPSYPEWAALASNFTPHIATRAILVVDVSRIGTSCGYGVPLMKYDSERTQLDAWANKKGPEALKEYRREKNSRSLDGLPGVEN